MTNNLDVGLVVDDDAEKLPHVDESLDKPEKEIIKVSENIDKNNKNDKKKEIKTVKNNKNDDDDVCETVMKDHEKDDLNLEEKTDFNLLGARPKSGEKNGSTLTENVLPLIKKKNVKDYDATIENKPKKREGFDDILSFFKFKSTTGSGEFQGKSSPKSGNRIGQNANENVKTHEVFQRSIAVDTPVGRNSPVRKIIRKGTVAAMRDMFDHEVAEENDEVGNTLKRLRRPCLKPIRSSSGKKKPIASRISKLKVRRNSNQASILDYYPKDGGEEQESGVT